VVTATKQRDLERGNPMPFELVPVNILEASDDEPAVTSCVVKQIAAEEQPQQSKTSAFELRGKAQRQLVAALRARAEAKPDAVHTLTDLRQIGKEIGLSKSTARSAVDALATSPYMQPSIGGYRFTDGVRK
jgi:hypothetical protein